jgi:transcriptional accessory protein Tex/SPT6
MQPTNFAEEYLCEAFNDKVKVFEGVVKLAAQELAAQPIIRNMIKKDLRENGYLTTKPTE